jgi:hypothetical protein
MADQQSANQVPTQAASQTRPDNQQLRANDRASNRPLQKWSRFETRAYKRAIRRLGREKRN